MRASPQHEIFMARLSEWQGALIVTLWGFVLMLPLDTFAAPNWIAFRWLDELTVGTLMGGFGVIRLSALAANGAWRPMYHVRAITACISSLIWLSVVFGFLSGARISVWAAVYPVLAVFEAVSVFRAIGDAARADRAAALRRAMTRTNGVPA